MIDLTERMRPPETDENISDEVEHTDVPAVKSIYTHAVLTSRNRQCAYSTLSYRVSVLGFKVDIILYVTYEISRRRLSLIIIFLVDT